MGLFMSVLSKGVRSVLQIPAIKRTLLRHQPQKEAVVVVMGATGTGKSRLSIDLATHFSGEVINSDKIQVYEGLNITTNKITDEESHGVPHHLLGTVHPDSDFSAYDFRTEATLAVKSILGRGRLPIICGGSNSFIEALVDASFEAEYDCCFLWIDVAEPELHRSLAVRVDNMVERGMVEEVRDFFEPNGDYSKGIRRAIGVPEFDRFFRSEADVDEETRGMMLKEALDAVKMNTDKLVGKQLERIRRLRDMNGWRVHRLDATEVFRRSGAEVDEVWDEMVAGPAVALVDSFLKYEVARTN